MPIETRRYFPQSCPLKSLALIALAAASAGTLFAADNVLSKQEKADGWILLFDGKTLNGWESVNLTPPGRGGGRARGKQAKQAPQPGALPAVGSNPRACSTEIDVPPGASHWEVMHGMLTPCGDPAGYLSTKTDYKDFVLKVDFRTGPDTNSGVFVRSPQGIQGYEVQIWRAQPAGYNTGSIVGTGKTDREYKFIPNQWNHYEITADGDHLMVVLNGEKTLDVHDSKFADGRIRLQYQKYPIEFKNIKLKMIQH
ncbi:MAG TPA: DUF1080 domain-containing protein [Bryobacteraceae bacterium]|nr:DUF1080 domain-containing protein [Bryobacteraceae bacterium]